MHFWQPTTRETEKTLSQVNFNQVFSGKTSKLQGVEGLDMSDEEVDLFRNHFYAMMKAEARSGKGLPQYTQNAWTSWMEVTYKGDGNEPGRDFFRIWLWTKRGELYEKYFKQGKTLQDFYHDEWYEWLVSKNRGHTDASFAQALANVQKRNTTQRWAGQKGRELGTYVKSSVQSIPQMTIGGVVGALSVGKVSQFIGKTAGDATSEISTSVGKLVNSTMMPTEERKKLEGAALDSSRDIRNWRGFDYSSMPSPSGRHTHFYYFGDRIRAHLLPLKPTVDKENATFDSALLDELQKSIQVLGVHFATIDKLTSQIEERSASSAAPKLSGEEIAKLKAELRSEAEVVASALAPWLVYVYTHSIEELSDPIKLPEAVRVAYGNAFDKFFDRVEADSIEALKNKVLGRLEGTYMALVKKSGLISEKTDPSVPAKASAP